MQNDLYEFDKEKPSNKVWEVTHYVLNDENDYDLEIGQLLFSFDKKKIYNLWTDYPYNFSKEEKEVFDKEYPYWADFFKERVK